MYILAIETSCDETSFAISKNGIILSNIISSQIDTHKKYGGVVPEIASRLHFENFGFILDEVIKKSKIKITKIDKIAYTEKPGLIGCLHIGKMIAKTLSSYLNKDIISCNHLEGHIYSSAIDNKFEFPLLSLVVSGGHTQLYLLKKNLDFNLIGSTLDDAIGECYDKIARMLKLSYPGGPIIDKLSKSGKNVYKLSIPKKDKTLDFSFSGLKSASANFIDKNKNNLNINDFCSSFQNVAIQSLINKIELATKKYKPKMITIAGGVSANSLLREKIKEFCNKNNILFLLPDLKYCTDNAAMIARLAYEKLINKDKKKEKGKIL